MDFTLVELMVVVFIIGLMSAAVVMTMPGAERRAVQDAERFAARAAAARDIAVLTARPVRVWVAASGFGFDTRVKGAWQPLTDGDAGQWQLERGFNPVHQGCRRRGRRCFRRQRHARPCHRAILRPTVVA